MIVILVAWFKKPIVSALGDSQISRFKAGPSGVELEFREDLREARQELGEAEIDHTVGSAPTDHPAVHDFRAEMERLALASPRAVVMESHARLEGALRDVVDDPALTRGSRPPSMRMLARAAAKQELISPGGVSAIEELSHLRNLVVHEPDHVISESTALDYVDLASEMIAHILSAGGATIEGPT